MLSLQLPLPHFSIGFELFQEGMRGKDRTLQIVILPTSRFIFDDSPVIIFVEIKRRLR